MQFGSFNICLAAPEAQKKQPPRDPPQLVLA
jgi:hypothetical protein